ncbi:MAG: galactose-1-phosphate uridylyltransferase, partial [Clostridia bacterium]|nr:galactose-1-phosphate uridylyltransferase [Clostridia bacterium]
MKNTENSIKQLVEYAINNGMISGTDRTWAANRLMEILGIDEISEETAPKNDNLEEILDDLCDYAFENGLIESNSVVYRDLFDTKLMGALMPPPSVVISKFNSLYSEDPEKATDYYYALSKASNYIREYRVKKDLKWKTESTYGEIDITINLSKPEKDPKAIAAAKLLPQSGYPKCLLCCENEGYAGRVNSPARQNHRIIPLDLDGDKWFIQYSPYVYYNEHCIAFSAEHTPMKIDRNTFKKLLDFETLLPHYFIGSNADLPIVGGSI